MKRILFALAFLLGLPALALSASFTITFTAGQDTTIQTRIIPAVNTQNCARFGLPPSCTSAQLVTRGCVAVAFPAKNYNTCTIYTADATGEGIFLQDDANRQIVFRFVSLFNTDADSFLVACRGRTLAQQNQICVDAGLASGCNPCP